MNCRLCLLNCRWLKGFGRQSLQDSAFPGKSLGTSAFVVSSARSFLFALLCLKKPAVQHTSSNALPTDSAEEPKNKVFSVMTDLGTRACVVAFNERLSGPHLSTTQGEIPSLSKSLALRRGQPFQAWPNLSTELCIYQLLLALRASIVCRAN